MTDQGLVKKVEDWDAEIGGVDQGLIEMQVDGNKLLLFAKDEHYCLIVAHRLTKQVTLRKIIRVIRALGFKTLIYPWRQSWECSELSAYAFFKKEDDRKSLQIKTDKIFARLTRKINRLTRLWDEEVKIGVENNENEVDNQPNY